MANEKRLIDANALVEIFEKWKAEIHDEEDYDPEVYDAIDSCVAQVEDAPTVDAVEVVHGEWSTIEDDYCGLTALQCSKCNQEYWFEDDPPLKIYNYCPNCSAKMDGDVNG